jgi:hypothetical protein
MHRRWLQGLSIKIHVLKAKLVVAMCIPCGDAYHTRWWRGTPPRSVVRNVQAGGHRHFIPSAMRPS